ncbi:MAG: hypothetical protein K940chlam9_01350 [Chlamydiae bacterium]|nr:hypothetical protein [Chlamydiota bacterium]
MNDTHPEITKKIREMIQSKTPEERLKMGCSMNETSRYLVTQFILRENPNISQKELRQEIFLKYYGPDFDPVTRAKILEQL